MNNRHYVPNHSTSQAKRRSVNSTSRWARQYRRSDAGMRNRQEPFAPPEDWHEPQGDGRAYRVVTQKPGPGYRHVVTAEQIRTRLAELPQSFLQALEVVQLSRVTRKKQSFPCYGMQWGPAIYLYPIEETLEETFYAPPHPQVVNESRMYGGAWDETEPGVWRLTWTEQSVQDFYLNNILIHELGHLVDERNRSYVDRERYAEWFAIQYGYQASGGRLRRGGADVRKRHHR